ncbi:MAG: ATP-binding protein [Planctomycetales bacterium]
MFPFNVLAGRDPNANTDAIGLADDASNYLRLVRHLAADLRTLDSRKHIVAALRSINPSVSSVELDHALNPKDIVVGHDYNGQSLALSLADESEGFRRFYAHLLALYQQPPKQTLIVEHPEDGIHPGALDVLADEFKKAPEEGRGQVILTTHNPEFLNNFDADQIRVVELQDSNTQINFLSPSQKEAVQDNLLDPGELLTVDFARSRDETAEAQGE